MKGTGSFGWHRKPRFRLVQNAGVLLAFLVLASGALPGLAAANGQPAEISGPAVTDAVASPSALETRLAATVGLPDGERERAYSEISFSPEEWTAGLVLSRRPFTVVKDVFRADEASDAAARVMIWTGLLARADRDLIVYWDEVTVDAEGKPVFILLTEPKIIPGYFDAEHQLVFRGADHIGLYPWANIPTDAEAARTETAPVENGGVIDMYGFDFGQASVDRQDTGSVRLLPAVPDRIGRRPAYAGKEIENMPSDIAGHWAEAYTLDLMRAGIVDGYADGTIRPDKLLTRGEFIKLVLTALHLSPSGEPAGYPDVGDHWASPYVAAAERTGIVPAGDGKIAFGPDDPAGRAEMAVVLRRALAALHVTSAERTARFPDADGLDDEVRDSIDFAAGIGLLSGFPDGTFRPGEPLTRAQGFTVIAKLLEWSQEVSVDDRD